MANYYYLNERGERKGPLSLENIKALRLAPATMVWREGMADWARADSLPELRTATAGGGISALRVVLIVFAVVGTLVFTLAGRFVAAFAASLVDARPSLPALILFCLIALALLLHVIFKRNKLLIEVMLFSFPFEVAAIFTFVYYNNINYTSYYRDGRCFICKHGDYGVLNCWGVEQVPCEYSSLHYNDREHPEFLYAQRGNAKGIIDLHGNIILPFEYNYLEPMEDTNLFEVGQHGKYGLVERDGTPVLPCAYDNLSRWHDTRLIQITQGDLDGLITPDGEVVLPCRYLFAKQDKTGLTKINEGGWVDDDHKIRGGRWGVIDKEGNIVLGCNFEKISINSEEIRTEADGHISYYDLRGNYQYGLKDWH